jgi:siroheme synthase
MEDARAMRTLLADLGDAVGRAGVSSPALLVVGRVAGFARAEDLLGLKALEAIP